MRRRIKNARSRVAREQVTKLTRMTVTLWFAAAGALAILTCVLVETGRGYAGSEQRAGMIAFLRAPAGIGTSQTSLFVVRADGTGLRRLTSSRSHVYRHAWSPGGNFIAYTDGGSLWLVRPNGTGRRRLALRSQITTRALTVAWAPDGKALAVGGDGFAASQTASIYVVPTDEGTPRRLPVDDARDLSWSPRGDEIAYDSPAGVIRAVRSDGSARPRVILPGTPGCYGPAWSADGLRVAAACGDSHGRYAYIDVVNADGRNRRRLIRHAYNEYGFAWSPGGRRILYGREDGQGIYAIGAEGVADRKITSDSPAQVGWGALTWSPDGRAIAYTTDRTGNGDLYVIGTDGRSKLRLTRSTASDIDPSWAPE